MPLKNRATGILVQEGKLLLLQQHVKTATHERAWSLPGGTQQEGETLEEILQREMREETGLDVGADAYITKPFEPQILLDKIHELLKD